MVSSAKSLDDAYRTEKNVNVRERLLLVRRVLVDNEQTARVAENEILLLAIDIGSCNRKGPRTHPGSFRRIYLA